MDAAPDIKIGFNRHSTRFHGPDQIVQDPIGDGFMERPVIAMAPEIKLEALEFHAEFIGHIGDPYRREIRLAGLGTKAREFRALHLDGVVAPRARILEDLEFF